MPTRVHSVSRSREKPASRQYNGECAKPSDDFRNLGHSSSASRWLPSAVLLRSVHERTDRDYQFIGVPDEIPKLLTRPRTSAICISWTPPALARRRLRCNATMD